MRKYFGISRRRSIHFVYSEKLKHTGSTIMRGQQLSEIAARYLPKYNVHYTNSKHEISKSILILTKGALLTLQKDEIIKLKQLKNLLIYDPVDAKLPSHTTELAGVIIASSYTAYIDYKANFPNTKVVFINHHVDPRVEKIGRSFTHNSYGAGYFGLLENTIVYPSIEKLVDFVAVDTSKIDTDWMGRLKNYSLHYAIRNQRSNDSHKPFLKGFTAAHCGANILIQADQPEAVHWLGKDYPYLLHGEVNEKTILKMLDKIKLSYGSSDWEKALKTMENLKDNSSSKAIGMQLQQMFKNL